LENAPIALLELLSPLALAENPVAVLLLPPKPAPLALALVPQAKLVALPLALAPPPPCGSPPVPLPPQMNGACARIVNVKLRIATTTTNPEHIEQYCSFIEYYLPGPLRSLLLRAFCRLSSLGTRPLT